MYILYVDESGDTGVEKGSTPYFFLTGVIINTHEWNDIYENLYQFRKFLKEEYKLPITVELKAFWLLNDDEKIYRKFGLTTPKRIEIFQKALEFISSLSLQIINIYINEAGKEKLNTKKEIEETAFKFLIQRFHNFLEDLKEDNHGFIIYDGRFRKFISQTQRKCRVYNPVPSKFKGSSQNIPLKKIIEDTFFKDSRASYILQIADLIVGAFKFKFIKFKGKSNRKFNTHYNVEKFFDKIDHLVLKEASTKRGDGIVIYK